jgi:hypothetical protein
MKVNLLNDGVGDSSFWLILSAPAASDNMLKAGLRRTPDASAVASWILNLDIHQEADLLSRS